MLRWIAEAVGYPGDAAGLLTSGGSWMTGRARRRAGSTPPGRDAGRYKSSITAFERTGEPRSAVFAVRRIWPSSRHNEVTIVSPG